ncbi:MAG: DMT family transporter [Candidatus Thorarchaeota archaeon]
MQDRNKARVMLVIASFIWGSSFIVGRVAVFLITPIELALFENLFGTIVLALALFIQRRSGFLRLLYSTFTSRVIIILGLLNGFAYSLQYFALSYTTAINTSLLVNLGITFVPLFAYIRSREKIKPKQALALVVGLVGAIFVVTKGDTSLLLQGEVIGNLLALTTGIVWALWIVIAYEVIIHIENPLTVATSNAGISVLVLGVVSFVMGSFNIAALTSIDVWLAIIYLSVFSIGVAYVMYYGGLKYMGGTSSVFYLLLQPVISMILAVVLLEEILTPLLIFGAMLILVATLFAD